MVRFFCKTTIIWSLVLLVVSAPCSLSQLSESELNPMGSINPLQFGRQGEAGKPIKIERHQKPTLKDLFPHRDLPTIPIQPISLSGVKVPGLSEEQVNNLGTNYFCVINNTDFDSFSSLYKKIDNSGNLILSV